MIANSNHDPTMEMAQFVSGFSIEHVPEPVLNKIKLHILDTLGTGLLGSMVPWSQSVRAVVSQWGGIEESTVWGTSLRLPAVNTAMVNAMSVHSFELDDTHIASYVHPGSATVPTALSLWEKLGPRRDGDFVAAIIAGYEIAIRVGLSIGTSSFQRGFYPPGLAHIFGAAATSARLLGLDAERTANAFFLAATQAAGVYSPTPVKRFNTAKAVQNGILASLLSQNHFNGVLNAFTAEVGGFCAAFADDYDVGVLSDGLGTKFHMLDVGFKIYSCSRPNHTAIDAARELREAHPEITPLAIESVAIECTTPTYRFGVGFEVNTIGNAFMSLPYCVAAMLVDGDVFVDQFTEEKLRDPQIRDLLARTQVTINPEYDRLGPALRDTVKVCIRLKDGSRFEKQLCHARGHKEWPLAEQELSAKFRKLASRILDAKTILAIEDAVRGIEYAENIDRLPEFLTGQPAVR